MMTLQCKTRLCNKSIRSFATSYKMHVCRLITLSQVVKGPASQDEVSCHSALLSATKYRRSAFLFRKSIKGLIILVLNKSQIFECSLQVCHSQTMMRTWGFSLMMAAENWSVSKERATVTQMTTVWKALSANLTVLGTGGAKTIAWQVKHCILADSV